MASKPASVIVFTSRPSMPESVLSVSTDVRSPEGSIEFVLKRRHKQQNLDIDAERVGMVNQNMSMSTVEFIYPVNFSEVAKN